MVHRMSSGRGRRQRKLMREDYEELMDMGSVCHHHHRDGGMSVNSVGRISPETMMLTHLMSKANKNVKQRRAVIDSMNASQIKHLRHMVKGVLHMR